MFSAPVNYLCIQFRLEKNLCTTSAYKNSEQKKNIRLFAFVNNMKINLFGN